MAERLGREEQDKTSVTIERQGSRLTLHLNRLPLGQGSYEIEGLGTLGIRSVVRPEDNMQEIILDCTACPELQGSRQRLERRIQLYNGYGSQMIAPDKFLQIDTGDHREGARKGGLGKQGRAKLREMSGRWGNWWGTRPVTWEEEYWARTAKFHPKT